MSLNNNVGTLMIFYVYATSITIVLLMMFDTITIVSALAMPDHQPSIASANMHNLIKYNGNEHEHTNNLNNNEKNKRNQSIIALLPVLTTQQNHSITIDAVTQLDQHSFEMENSRKYLHLDEHNFVATTPKIHTTQLPNRYEQGLEDYEEAVARVDKIKDEQKKQQAYGLSGLETVLSFIETASNVWNKVSSDYEQNKSTKQSTITNKSNDGITNDFDANDHHNNNTGYETTSTDIAEGRYIKGDPLRGYYDFIITEGSYKFWAGFQLFTAGLMIYSTFAAIYYSKVNPVVGDYDYTAYLGGARSMADDPEPLQPSTSPWSELANSYIFQTAAHGFQFVLDAIEKIPKT